MYVDFNLLPARLSDLVRDSGALALAAEDDCEIEKLAELAALPDLKHVVSLNLIELGVEDGAAKALFSSRYLTGLESLTFGDDGTEIEVLEALAAANLPALCHLEFQGYWSSRLAEPEVKVLGESSFKDQLHTLNLFNCGMTAESAAALCDYEWPKLRTLSLSGGYYSHNEIGAEGAAAITSCASFDGLEVLGLSYNAIGDVGIERLSRAKGLRELHTLGLQANKLTHDGFKHWTVAEMSDQIKILDLSHNDLCERAMQYLVQSAPAELTTLTLYNNPIGDVGIRMLTRAPMSERLTYLNLAQTNITDEGGEYLLESTYLNNLEALYLDLNPGITKGMFARLADRFGDALKA